MEFLCEDILSNRLDFSAFIKYGGWSVLLFAIVTLSICKYGKNNVKSALAFCALLEYVWLVLCFTVLCRHKGELEQFYFIPFCNYGNNELCVVWGEMLMNVIMFVPIGVLLKVAFKQIRWYQVVAIGFLLSTSTETLQWTFKCGSCETNDLINNTIGSIVGYCVIMKIKEKWKKSQTL